MDFVHSDYSWTITSDEKYVRPVNPIDFESIPHEDKAALLEAQEEYEKFELVAAQQIITQKGLTPGEKYDWDDLVLRYEWREPGTTEPWYEVETEDDVPSWCPYHKLVKSKAAVLRLVKEPVLTSDDLAKLERLAQLHKYLTAGDGLSMYEHEEYDALQLSLSNILPFNI